MSNHNKKKNSTVKVGKVSISQEKAGNYKLRFSHNGQRYSHGLGSIDLKNNKTQLRIFAKKLTLIYQSYFKNDRNCGHFS